MIGTNKVKTNTKTSMAHCGSAKSQLITQNNNTTKSDKMSTHSPVHDCQIKTIPTTPAVMTAEASGT